MTAANTWATLFFFVFIPATVGSIIAILVWPIFQSVIPTVMCWLAGYFATLIMPVLAFYFAPDDSTNTQHKTKELEK